ncbi:isocitrate dehydrogenase [NAD] subunit gamma, mitochondrial-like [Ischnura elegans]|uniref:isocitrate dehydrogenase [NAD] subunit gamma, mitochondrial-like n=1 Tax=Ischnura elegans TaxID=197161 RepID=UPI001ED8BB7A|nr:isocitrate dehydrogenase [NAD] subunit gamma, mitochondrial-like [Ischnura elegans]
MAIRLRESLWPLLKTSKCWPTYFVRKTSMSAKNNSLHKHPSTKRSEAIPAAKYGGRHTATMLPGGGIGPELMTHVKEVFRFAGVPVDFETISIDPRSTGNEELDDVITSIRRNGVCIKGNIETKSLSTGVHSRNVVLRSSLDLFVSVLHCKSYPGVVCRHKGIDVVVIRQNTDGEYSMLEHESVPGVVESLKIITTENAERVARYAFEYAKDHGRRKVTTVHKANIMKLSDGLFLETSRRVAKDYPEIDHNDMIVDNCSMQLVMNPHQFDVMNTTNLYGAIVSNILCGLVGGAGLISGINYGGHSAVFEPGTRTTASRIAGKNIANPAAMLNASADMLKHLGYNQHASNIKKAIELTINEDRIHTPDLGGTYSSEEVVHNVMRRIEKLSGGGH